MIRALALAACLATPVAAEPFIVPLDAGPLAADWPEGFAANNFYLDYLPLVVPMSDGRIATGLPAYGRVGPDTDHQTVLAMQSADGQLLWTIEATYPPLVLRPQSNSLSDDRGAANRLTDIHVAETSDGGVYLVAMAYGDVTLAGVDLSRDEARHRFAVFRLDRDGEPVWHDTFDLGDWRIEDIAVVPDDRLALLYQYSEARAEREVRLFPPMGHFSGLADVRLPPFHSVVLIDPSAWSSTALEHKTEETERDYTELIVLPDGGLGAVYVEEMRFADPNGRWATIRTAGLVRFSPDGPPRQLISVVPHDWDREPGGNGGTSYGEIAENALLPEPGSLSATMVEDRLLVTSDLPVIASFGPSPTGRWGTAPLISNAFISMRANAQPLADEDRALSDNDLSAIALRPAGTTVFRAHDLGVLEVIPQPDFESQLFVRRADAGDVPERVEA